MREPMPAPPITDTARLAEFCARLSGADYVTVDTEFMRENTYWPVLCLVQIAGPDDAAAVDTLADGIDLAPLYELMADEKILKVFHAGRQDLEIFYHHTGKVPAPVFDTQLAAMVCGFGDQISYENLLARTIGVTVDKASRFTDWSRRPLSERQLDYALADVTHLRPVYEKLAKQMKHTGRDHWLDEEMAVLTAPETYRVEPEEAWRRIKGRGGKGKRFLAVLVELAAWREREAQRRDIPRNRMLRDEAIMEIASHAPRKPDTLAHVRGISTKMAEGPTGKAVLQAVEDGIARPAHSLPVRPERPERLPPGLGPLTDLLKVLLKQNCEKKNVATRLVASGDDLERIAADDEADVPALKGWRREIFGDQALALKHGKLALAADGKKIRVITLD
jgi:ribonuclease D